MIKEKVINPLYWIFVKPESKSPIPCPNRPQNPVLFLSVMMKMID